MRSYFVYVIVSFFNLLCCAQHRVQFNDSLFYAGLAKNEVTVFVSCLKFEDIDRCIDGPWLEFRNMGYEKYLTTTKGDSVKLTVMTKKMASYVENRSNDKFLALSVFLYEKGHATKKLYDDMLKVCIQLDSTNVIAHYELAKLRFNGGYIGLSFFLIDKISQKYSMNREIVNLRNSFVNEYGDDIYNKALDYDSYLKLNPHYIED